MQVTGEQEVEIGNDYQGVATSTSATMLSNVATTTLGAGAVGEFTSAVSNLLADTTYYIRAYATNSAGTGYGVIRSFFTGNSTVTRKMRLFEGYRLKFLNGKMLLHQR